MLTEDSQYRIQDLTQRGYQKRVRT